MLDGVVCTALCAQRVKNGVEDSQSCRLSLHCLCKVSELASSRTRIGEWAKNKKEKHGAEIREPWALAVPRWLEFPECRALA